MRVPIGLTLLLALLSGDASRAQSPQLQAPDQPFRAATSAIVVDVIVRDGRRRLVTNLSRTDFELSEDGVPQQITSFRAVNGAPGAAAADPAGPDGAVVALVFDRLSQEGRALARRAAHLYVDEAHRPIDRVAVFAIDWSLAVAQDYTGDRDALKRAVGRVTGQLFTEGRGSPDLTASAPRTDGWSDPLSQRVHSAAEAVRVFDRFRDLETLHQAFATTLAVRAITHSVRDLPGRKAIILFSEGLVLPEPARPQFYAAIEAANRANVSIYALDAAGLRTRSPFEETRRIVGGGGPISGTLVDAESTLHILARETSGRLVNNTNNLVPGLRRIAEEMHGYYLLTYTPTNQQLDGKFRKIAVKVQRPNVQVWARKGYRAPAVAPGTTP